MAVVSGTTYSIRSADDGLLVIGHSNSLPGHSTGALRTIGGLTVTSITGGHVLVDGHTLPMGSTLTLGSGRAITRVAITTNNAGQTELLGDTTTMALGTGRLGARTSSAMHTYSSSPQSASAICSYRVPLTPPSSATTANVGARSVTQSWIMLVVAVSGLILPAIM